MEIQALNELVEAISPIVYGPRSKTKILVCGSPGIGSFKIDFIVLAEVGKLVFEKIKDFDETVERYSTDIKIIQILFNAIIIAILYVEDKDEAADYTIKILEKEIGKSPTATLLRWYRKHRPAVCNWINKITSPLKNKTSKIQLESKNGSVIRDIDPVYLEAIENNDYFSMGDSLIVVGPMLNGSNKGWTFQYNDRLVRATVQDEHFLEDVKRGFIKFTNETTLKAAIKKFPRKNRSTQLIVTQVFWIFDGFKLIPWNL